MLCNQLIANVESQLTKSQRRSLNKNHWTLYKMKILIEIFEDILLKLKKICSERREERLTT